MNQIKIALGIIAATGVCFCAGCGSIPFGKKYFKRGDFSFLYGPEDGSLYIENAENGMAFLANGDDFGISFPREHEIIAVRRANDKVEKVTTSGIPKESIRIRNIPRQTK